MRNVLTIFKKEWDRVIKDKRLVFTVIFLPGLMIFLIYSFMGTAMQNSQNNFTEVAIVNQTEDFKWLYRLNEDLANINVIEIEASAIGEYKELINQEKWALLIVFPENFESYDGVGEKPIVTIYSNPNDLTTSNVVNRFTNYLFAYQNSLSEILYGDTNYFYVDNEAPEPDENRLIGTIMGQLLPMLVIMFLFAGAMSIGPEAIAGEKERGTLSTLLITPIKRSELAMGKILSLSAIALLSALSSFLGITLSLPKLLNGTNADMSIYGVEHYFMILLILISTTFVIVGIISIISAFARSLKEATAYVTPIYILTILVSIGTSFSSAEPSVMMLLFPIYNSVQSLAMILSFSDNAWLFTIISSCVNLVYLIIFIAILNKMFNSEKIMFAR